MHACTSLCCWQMVHYSEILQPQAMHTLSCRYALTSSFRADRTCRSDLRMHVDTKHALLWTEMLARCWAQVWILREPQDCPRVLVNCRATGACLS